MGITDIDLVFDHIDVSKCGYITMPQISDLLSSIYVSSIPIKHIEAAIKQICGSEVRVAKNQFIDILVEIERRQVVEKQAYWDFQALDYNGDHRISLKDAFMLFEEFHGDHFSLETWRGFLDSRRCEHAGVSFDEVAGWLCDLPGPGSAPPHLVKEEETRLDTLMASNTDEEFECLQDIQKLSGINEDEQEIEDTRFHARRRLNKWNKQGIEAMLFDEGVDAEQDDVKKAKSRDGISMSVVMEAVDMKYSQIQDKLLMVMAKYAAVVEGEYLEIFEDLQQQLRRIRPQSLDGDVWRLPGARAVLPASLRAMMGELPAADLARLTRTLQWRSALLAEGKTHTEVDDIVRQDYNNFTEGSGVCGNLLICLRERHREEKSAVVERVRGETAVAVGLAAERVRLERQLGLLDEEQEFYTTAVSIGLAERSPPVTQQGYSWDRVRSEDLAAQRLSTRKGRKLTRSSKILNKDSVRGHGLLDLQLLVAAELERKQFYEREAFIYMLQCGEMNAAVVTAERQSPSERHRRRVVLRNQHTSWRESVRLDNQAAAADSNNHLIRLQDAVALYWVEQQADAEKQFTYVGDLDLAAAILADLQETQEQEFAAKLKEIVRKTPDDLSAMLSREAKARVLEFFDNISTVVLSTAEVSEAEREFVDALTDKYHALKDQIFMFALKDKYGGDWERMTSKEKEKEILKMRKEEKTLRGEGKLEEMSALIGPRAQALPSIVFMLGESKKYSRSEESGSLESNRPGINILADLGARYDVEEDSLLSWLRQPSVQSMAGTKRRLTLLKIQLEKHTAKTEQNFEVAFIALGLMERLHKNRHNRQAADTERQSRLAVKRVTLRRHRLDQQENIDSTFRHNPKPSGDLYEWRRACVLEVLQSHGEERELLLALLQDDSLGDLAEVVEMMTPDDRQCRLCQLAAKRGNLNLDDQDDRDEYHCVLEESAAVQSVCKKLSLKATSASSVSTDDVAAAILSDVQHCQDCQLHDILEELGNQSEEELQSQWLKQCRDRQIKSVKNVFQVLTTYDGVGGENDLLQLVDDKYTVLRDRLLLESLQHRHGDVSTSAKQILTAQQQALTFWNENNQAGLVSLLGEEFNLTDSVTTLMGVNRLEWEEWTVQQKGSDMALQEKEPSGVTAQLIVQELFDRFHNEKLFIKHNLKGSHGRIMTPNDRVVLLSRLNREVTLAGKCEKFKMAAILTGLLERQTISKNCCLAADQGRYLMLANNEWVELKSGNKPMKTKSSVEIIQTSERLVLQNNVLSLLTTVHQAERQILLTFLDSRKDVGDVGDVENIARLSSQQERFDQLMLLNNQRNKLLPDNVQENADILQEAALIKRESRRCQLHRRADTGTDDVTDIEAGVSLMAELLQQQNSDAELHLHTFLTQTVDDLADMQNRIRLSLENSRCENVATILFSREEAALETTEELLEAVEGKYNALNDKLLAEALMKQIGDTEWFDLTSRERQRRLTMLKLKQKQLLQTGKYDEAAALLGEALSNERTLRKLMGDSQAEYERKLKERLAKRKQRLDNGLSEEECDILEVEDRQKEEKEESKEKNILIEMEKRLAQEKDAVLSQMQRAGDEVERERERQRALVQLRREQRRVRQEDSFDAAARLLGIAEHSANKLQTQQEDEQLRQKRLAQQRLDIARRRRKQGMELPPQETSDKDLSIDDKTLVETILSIVDQQHTIERSLFIKLLDEDIADVKCLETLSKEEIKSHLAYLSELRQSWRLLEDASPDQQMAIFQEAIQLSMELKKRSLDESQLSSSVDDCKVALLTDLQMCQDRKVNSLMSDMEDKSTQSMKALYEEQIKAKLNGCHDNIATVLQLVDEAAMQVSLEEISSEKQVIQALEKKYDALKDKLIIETLMKQIGADEWNRLSERDRQRHLVRIRVEERRLRQEGRVDEVAVMLEQHLHNQQELERLLDDTRLSAKEELEARLTHRRQLKAEREAQGLSVDEDTLDAIQDKEEKEKPRRLNILHSLENKFEEEKCALLASLSRQTDHLQAERERQLTLARLRRDRKCLQQEDKLDAAFVIFSLGQQHEADREKSYFKEKERQRLLAQERLAARRKKKTAVEEGDTNKLEQQLVEEMNTGEENKESGSVQQSLLDSTDLCHDNEREVLLQLLQTAFDDSKRKKSFRKLSQEDLKTEMAKLQKEHAKWLAQSQHAVMTNHGPSKPSDMAKRRAQQFKLLSKAMTYRLEVEERFLQAVRPDLGETGVREELSVSLLADLQHKQSEDLKSVHALMLQKDDEFLEKFRGVQEMSRRAGWLVNLSSALFTVHEHDALTAESKLEAEFVNEKHTLINTARNQGEEADIDVMIKDLEEKFANKKKDVLSELARERLASPEQSKENEETATFELLKLTDGQVQPSSDKPAETLSPLKLLQERLAVRRQARHSGSEGRPSGSEGRPSGSESRPSTRDSATSRSSLLRQKTLASFEVTEEEKQATTQRLINQQRHLHSRLIEDQARQEQLLKQRIEARKGKRQHEVSELLSLGERQKTILVKSKMDERERQRALLSERVARVKYERTVTEQGSPAQADGSPAQADAFSSLAGGGEGSGDHRMETLAQRMQQKFTQEAEQTSTASETLMDDTSRMELLKERIRQKKLDKEAKAGSEEK